jgi:uncharacterized membrane protein
MTLNVEKRRPSIATVLFALLDPIPFGMFVAALIFDAIYANSAVVMWFKSAAWLIVIGLLFAVTPRFINLAWVWFSRARVSTAREKIAFVLYFFGVVAAIFNAFVHSRDAYGMVPEGLWLSILTVVLLVLSKALTTLQLSDDDYRVRS